MFGSLRDALRDRARVSAVTACLRELTLKPRNMEDEIRTTVLPVAASETVPVIRRWVEADARLKRVANPLFGAFAARLLDPPSGADAAA